MSLLYSRFFCTFNAMSKADSFLETVAAEGTVQEDPDAKPRCRGPTSTGGATNASACDKTFCILEGPPRNDAVKRIAASNFMVECRQRGRRRWPSAEREPDAAARAAASSASGSPAASFNCTAQASKSQTTLRSRLSSSIWAPSPPTARMRSDHVLSWFAMDDNA